MSGYSDDVKLQILATAPPVVSIIAPTNNQVFAPPANVIVQVGAVDPEGAINNIELHVNGTEYEVNGGQMTLSNLLAGTYTLLAKVTDGAGASAISEGISFQVRVPNDHFTNRIGLTGAVVATTGTNVRATREDFEPYHGNYARRTIWWAWTAPANGTVTITTAGSDFDTILAVYTGTTLSQLTLVAYNNNSGDKTSRVTFPATADTTYQIVVGSDSSYQSGTVQLNIALQ